ncbi:MAG: hypothetical protein ABW221_27025 [Vicinamibacteria bacterium]
MTEEAPKSAYELAMERLRKKDREEGVSERPLTDEQRAAIAEARRVAEARFAEREILYQSNLRKVGDPDAAAALEEEYRRDRERITSDRDRNLDEIRRGR